ncbi:MAG: protein-disulfide reductase DsbD family protein, partial [Acidobacteria bacterium]|nr:protein-disulfide reductase DsbD family protein [Acidobacteriota bacterium]
YRVVGLRAPWPEFRRSHEVSYPRPEMYRFEPLDETVPVYKDQFRLVHDVTIPMRRDIAELAAEPGAVLRVEAVLEYQACDHDVCYLPQAVPLSWELSWRPLIR